MLSRFPCPPPQDDALPEDRGRFPVKLHSHGLEQSSPWAPQRPNPSFAVTFNTPHVTGTEGPASEVGGDRDGLAFSPFLLPPHFLLLNFGPRWLWRPTEESQRTPCRLVITSVGCPHDPLPQRATRPQHRAVAASPERHLTLLQGPGARLYVWLLPHSTPRSALG